MVYRHDNIEGIDAAILMHPTVWKASGHVDAFSDPLIDDKASKMRYRADQLIEGHIDKLRREGQGRRGRRASTPASSTRSTPTNPSKALHAVIMDEEIRSPDSGAFDWTDVRQFNLMFETHIGPASDSESKVYLRPETAQGIFVHFQNVRETARQQVPVRHRADRQGLPQRDRRAAVHLPDARVRADGDAVLRQARRADGGLRGVERRSGCSGTSTNGIRPSKLRWHEHEKLAHYADAAQDVQYEFPMGWQEVEGIHSRTDYDL